MADPSIIAALKDKPDALKAYLTSFNSGLELSSPKATSPSIMSRDIAKDVITYDVVDEKWHSLNDSCPGGSCCACTCFYRSVCCVVKKYQAGNGEVKATEGSCCGAEEKTYHVESVTKTTNCCWTGLKIKIPGHPDINLTAVNDAEKIKLLLQQKTKLRSHSP